MPKIPLHKVSSVHLPPSLSAQKRPCCEGHSLFLDADAVGNRPALWGVIQHFPPPKLNRALGSRCRKTLLMFAALRLCWRSSGVKHQHCCFSDTACFQEEDLLLAIKVCQRIWMTAVHVHRQVKHRENEHWHCSSDTRFRHSLDVSSSPAANYHLATAGNCTASLFLPTPCCRPI